MDKQIKVLRIQNALDGANLYIFHSNSSDCIFLFVLKCRTSSAVSVGGPFPAVWSLINTASTESSETGATSHTPCCKIMSLQREGIIYMGGETHFLSMSPTRIYSNEMRRGGRPNWLDSSQKREKHTNFSFYVHVFNCHLSALKIRCGTDLFAYGFYKYQNFYLLLQWFQSCWGTDKPYWSYGSSNTTGVTANSDGLYSSSQPSPHTL